MAWGTSGAFAQTFVDSHNGLIVLDLTLETHKVALYNNSVTPVFDANTPTLYSATNEVTGTGYTAGGALLVNTLLTCETGAIEKWDANDRDWTSATLSGANSPYGCMIYADALATSGHAKQIICGVSFGGPFSVTTGTFTIQWSGSGIMQIDYA